MKMFIAKSTNPSKFKSLFEILFHNFTTVCLTIDKFGIFSENVTNQNTIIQFFLPAEIFDEYTYTYDEPKYIGLGSYHAHHFKSIKNKSILTLSIPVPHVFDICIASTIDDYTVKLSASTEIIQNIANHKIDAYDIKPISLSCVTFNQLCKSLKSPTINLAKSNGQLHFSFFVAGISSKTLSFGKPDASDQSLFFNAFKSEQFTRLNKLSSFATEPINVYVATDKPIFIDVRSSIGTMKIIIMPTEE